MITEKDYQHILNLIEKFSCALAKGDNRPDEVTFHKIVAALQSVYEEKEKAELDKKHAETALEEAEVSLSKAAEYFGQGWK